MKTIVISDIHGYFDEFMMLLDKVNYRKGIDRLYLLGDYVDKGPKSKETVMMVKELSKTKNVKVIAGNHDEMFVGWLEGEDYRLNRYTGEKIAGDKTILSFCDFYKKESNEDEARKWINMNYKDEIIFLRNLPYYIEDDSHIYVHAGIDPKEFSWKQTSKKNFRWIREKFYKELNPHEKTVVFGHTASTRLYGDEQNESIWFSDKKIGIDGGIKFGGRLNALIINEEGNYEEQYIKIT